MSVRLGLRFSLRLSRSLRVGTDGGCLGIGGPIGPDEFDAVDSVGAKILRHDLGQLGGRLTPGSLCPSDRQRGNVVGQTWRLRALHCGGMGRGGDLGGCRSPWRRGYDLRDLRDLLGRHTGATAS